jgi:hypothetical protein
MNPLTNQQFKSYIQSLDITHELGYSFATDEVGQVCSYNIDKDEFEINDTACFQDDDFKLTSTQKNKITNYLYSEYSKQTKGAEPFTDEDYTHFKSLIH